MTVEDLKRIIEDLPDEAEVRIAHQPHYPLQAKALGVTYSMDLEEELGLDSNPDPVVWIIAAVATDYASRDLWEYCVKA